MQRRKPGQSPLTTSRKEDDQVELLSGVFEGKSTGCPIGFIVRNRNQHSKDYDNMRHLFRPSHADYTYHAKYGVRDHRGGGRSSARETIARVVGGAFAKLLLRALGVSITAWLMCLVQKLSYLYGHEDFTENGKISDYTRNQLTVMLGVAFGVNAAQKALKQLVQQLSIETAKRLPRMALTKTFYYPIIKQVAKWLGTNLTKNTFGRGAAKAIPLFGGVINGGIAYYSFKKVAKRFHKAMMEHPVMQASDAHAHDSHAHHEDHSDEYVEVVEEV